MCLESHKKMCFLVGANPCDNAFQTFKCYHGYDPAVRMKIKKHYFYYLNSISALFPSIKCTIILRTDPSVFIIRIKMSRSTINKVSKK